MPHKSHSSETIEKFLNEILDSELAINVYKQLVEDGGNTVVGIVLSPYSEAFRPFFQPPNTICSLVQGLGEPGSETRDAIPTSKEYGLLHFQGLPY